MTRPTDSVRVEVIAKNGGPAGTLDNFTSLQISNDLTSPGSAAFELGEDGSYNTLKRLLTLGNVFRVFVNSKSRLVGRVENNDIPLDVGGGSVVRFQVRTKLSDATYASANPRLSITNITLKDFILQLYFPLGYREADFHFSAATARNLMTGKNRKTGDDTVNLERIKLQEARIRPPETVFAAADRHLRRHGLMHWDGPDGKIVVGLPDDTQEPLYTFNAYTDRSRSQTNNIETITKVRDVSGMPTAVGIFGKGGNRTFSKLGVTGVAFNDEMGEFGFYRPLFIPAESVRTAEQADRAAARELSARSKGFDTYVLETDGLSFWDGATLTNYAHDTVATINSDNVGGNEGAYYVHRTTLYRDADGGDRTNLVMLKKGLWRL